MRRSFVPYGRRLVLENESSVLLVDLHCRRSGDFARDNLLRKLVEQQPLDNAFDGSCSELRVVTLGGYQVYGIVRYLHRYAVVLEHTAYGIYLQYHYLTDFVFGERREHYQFVDTV